MEEKNPIELLFAKYVENSCSPEEIEELYQYFGVAENEGLLTKYILDTLENTQPLDNELLQQVQGFTGRLELRLLEQIRSSQNTQTRSLSRWIPYAAAVALILSIGIYLFNFDNRQEVTIAKSSIDIAPGGNRATLTLTNGRIIDLSEAQTGIMIGEEITYVDGSDVLNEQAHALTHSLQLTTPKGGTYQVTLSDGTRVWLNAASTLKYPSRFDTSERVVELEGEAYFSVAKDESKPFKVVSEGQEVEVLGTEFNISAYKDEYEVKTTLVQGRVQIVNQQSRAVNRLLPGEQAIVHGKTIDVKSVNTVPYVAWKDGLFYFKKTPFGEMMRQVSRWYGVEIIYKQKVPKETFSGKVKRSVSLMGLMEILQVSTIDVTLKGDTLIIN